MYPTLTSDKDNKEKAVHGARDFRLHVNVLHDLDNNQIVSVGDVIDEVDRKQQIFCKGKS